MTDKNKNLLVRLGTAAVMLPLILFLLYQGSWWTAGLLAWGAASCTGEYINITLKGVPGIAWLAIIGAGATPFFVVVSPFHATELAAAGISVLMLATWAYHLLEGPLDDAPLRTAHIMMGAVYGAGGMAALMAVRQQDDGMWWLVAALVITWANDSAAYFAGRLFGKHKLYPAVSPNKTWEGFFGGMVGGIGGLFIERAFFFESMTVADCVVLGVLGGVLGPAGDLCESMLKRSYGVKDSGKMIPGHGGMLDRVDALLFNAPMVFIYIKFAR